MPRVLSTDLNLYAGLWVALVRGRVVASGNSAQETLLHCRSMRLKDEPVLRYVPCRPAKRDKKSANTNVQHA